MQIIITDNAMTWFKEEMEVEKGDFIRFFARYGGSNPFHEGYSIGMNREEPINAAVQIEKEGIQFFIEEDDLWFFADHNLKVSTGNSLDELSYEYVK